MKKKYHARKSLIKLTDTGGPRLIQILGPGKNCTM